MIHFIIAAVHRLEATDAREAGPGRGMRRVRALRQLLRDTDARLDQLAAMIADAELEIRGEGNRRNGGRFDRSGPNSRP
jgi:hypothetical protein